MIVPMIVAPMIIPSEDSTDNGANHTKDASNKSTDEAEQSPDQSKHESEKSAGYSDPDGKGENDDDEEYNRRRFHGGQDLLSS